jgi:hypothetical protein
VLGAIWLHIARKNRAGTHPTSTTLFPILSKVIVSILSFEDLTDNSNSQEQHHH